MASSVPINRLRELVPGNLTLRKISLLKEAGLSLEEIAELLKSLAAEPTSKKLRQAAHERLLEDVRSRLLEQTELLTKLADEVGGALQNASTCASCGAQDCKGCGRLRAWVEFGLSVPGQGEEESP